MRYAVNASSYISLVSFVPECVSKQINNKMQVRFAISAMFAYLSKLFLAWMKVPHLFEKLMFPCMNCLHNFCVEYCEIEWIACNYKLWVEQKGITAVRDKFVYKGKWFCWPGSSGRRNQFRSFLIHSIPRARAYWIVILLLQKAYAEFERPGIGWELSFGTCIWSKACFQEEWIVLMKECCEMHWSRLTHQRACFEYICTSTLNSLFRTCQTTSFCQNHSVMLQTH